MFNQSLGKLEGCWNYTPPHAGCASLRAVTHSTEECNLCVCLLTQALCSKPREGHVPAPSQIQFPIKVNTVWKCSHTLARCDGSWFEFSRLIKVRSLRAEFLLFLRSHDMWGFTVHGAPHADVREARHTEQRGLIKTTEALHQQSRRSLWGTHVYLIVVAISPKQGNSAVCVNAPVHQEHFRSTEVQMYYYLKSF